jgi:hypothetical protein
MRVRARSSIALLGFLLSAAARSQPLPVASHPEDLGISSQRLERVRRQMHADVESGRIPGAVLLIARNGKMASLDALGFQGRRSQTPICLKPALAYRLENRQSGYHRVKYHVSPPSAASATAITASIVATLLLGVCESNIFDTPLGENQPPR